MTGNLTGRYHVRICRSAFMDGHKICPRSRERAELRRHALKLRFWPNPKPEELTGMVMDLDWSYIRALSGEKIGELRIHDRIGDNDNLRIIFYVGKPLAEGQMPIIWILAAMQKKRDDFTMANIETFRARKVLIQRRFYAV